MLLAILAVLWFAQAFAADKRIGFSPGGIFLIEDEPHQRRDATRMAEAGACWVRLDIDWSRIEPARGAYDWSATDRAVRIVREAGLEVIGLASYTPAWARPTGTTSTWPPDDDGAFAGFAAAAANRYADRIGVWEIWNEPNLVTFWSSGPDPARYTRLLSTTTEAIRRAEPHVTILLGGLASVPDAPPGRIDPVTFAARVYAADGGRSFDAIAVHPYTYPELPSQAPTGTFVGLTDLHDLMVDRGDAEKGVWITEFGAPTGAAPTSVDDGTQAASIDDGFALFRSRPWIHAFLVFSLRDAGRNPRDVEQNFGLRRFDDAPKPAWNVYVRDVRDR